MLSTQPLYYSCIHTTCYGHTKTLSGVYLNVEWFYDDCCYTYHVLQPANLHYGSMSWFYISIYMLVM